MSDRGGFFEGVFFGAILGAALGLLFAPQSGLETRRKLRDLRDDNQDIIDDTVDRTETMIEKTKDAIEDGFEKLGKLIEENKTDAKGGRKQAS